MGTVLSEAISSLTSERLVHEIENRPGLIPVAIHDSSRQIRWLDLGGYHCYEDFFRNSLTAYSGLLRADPPAVFLSDFDDLLSVPTPANSLSPTGFIFNTGRCGSTLLAKVLARSRCNLVFSEVAAHNQIWRFLPPPGDPSGVEIYRKLVLAMGRRRLPTYQAHLIKFTSFNIAHFDMIRAAFPDVPALFLFRDPDAVVESYLRKPLQWATWNRGSAPAWEGPERAVECFLRQAASIDDPDFRCLDYSRLTPDFLGSILEFFGLYVVGVDLRLMLSEFSWNAKGARNPRPFESVAPTPGARVSTPVRKLYDELKARALIDWGEGTSPACLQEKAGDRK